MRKQTQIDAGLAARNGLKINPVKTKNAGFFKPQTRITLSAISSCLPSFCPSHRFVPHGFVPQHLVSHHLVRHHRFPRHLICHHPV